MLIPLELNPLVVGALAQCRTTLSKDIKSHFAFYRSNHMWGFHWTELQLHNMMQYWWGSIWQAIETHTSSVFQEAPNMQTFLERMLSLLAVKQSSPSAFPVSYDTQAASYAIPMWPGTSGTSPSWEAHETGKINLVFHHQLYCYPPAPSLFLHKIE